MNNTNIKVIFNISGDDFDIDDVTRRLDIEPSKYWKKGDKITGINNRRNYTGWLYCTEVQETLELNKELLKIKNMFSPKLLILNQLKKKYELDFSVEVVIIIEKEEVPSMLIDPEMIHFVSEIDGSIDIDTYIN